MIYVRLDSFMRELKSVFKGKTCGFNLEARNVVCEITS